MQLEILTPDAIIYNGEVISVSLPGLNGRFQVLNNHAPIISTLTSGEILIETADKNIEKFGIKGGILEILKNKVIVLA